MGDTGTFFEIAASGRINTAREWQDYLNAFHSQLPHANELFTLLQRHSGETSYAVLANAVAAFGASRVLDLGCGDGNLVDELLRRLPQTARVTGADSSETEIRMTRDRFADDRRASFDVADAAALLYGDASFDYVAAHQVLNFFPEIRPVLSEVERVLKPGGELGLIATRGWRKDQTANWQLLNHAALAVIQAEHPQFVWPLMGDQRIYREDGIAEIFEESKVWDIHTLSIETFNTRALMSPKQVAAIYNRLYLFATMPEKKRVLQAVETRARELAAYDIVEIDLPFRLVRIRKAAAATGS
jgi:ubiquinone/menaquinone biosynthesis C-methylase UbiE